MSMHGGVGNVRDVGDVRDGSVDNGRRVVSSGLVDNGVETGNKNGIRILFYALFIQIEIIN